MPRYRRRPGKGYQKHSSRRKNTSDFNAPIDADLTAIKEIEELSSIDSALMKSREIPALLKAVSFSMPVYLCVFSLLISLGSQNWDPFYIRYAWIIAPLPCVSFNAFCNYFYGLFVHSRPMFKNLNSRRNDLAIIIEKDRKSVIAERAARPEGFQNLSKQQYRHIQSSIKSTYQNKTVGNACVYHIAVDGWDFDRGYVGVSGDFYKRKRQHFKLLEAGNHDNKKLQNTYDKFGTKLKMKLIHHGVSEAESYKIEEIYRPLANMALNIRRGGR